MTIEKTIKWEELLKILKDAYSIHLLNYGESSFSYSLSHRNSLITLKKDNLGLYYYFNKGDNKTVQVGTDPGLGVHYIVLKEVDGGMKFLFTLVPSKLF